MTVFLKRLMQPPALLLKRAKKETLQAAVHCLPGRADIINFFDRKIFLENF